jgi:hypothetical protein
MSDYTIKTKALKFKAKKVYLTKGTCSHTFFHILNREFGYPEPTEEQAIDPLAGGIVQQGYQCGMLWGASMATGAEAYRRFSDMNTAIAVTISATQIIMESFERMTNTIACEEITNTDFNHKKSFLKFMLTGKFLGCFKLAGKWAPEAIQSAVKGLDTELDKKNMHAISCASELIKKMGGTEKEQVMVAGFAGGLGLSGDACGALSAFIWKQIFELVKTGDWTYRMNDEITQGIVKAFYEITDYQIECKDITEKRFPSIQDHTEYH